METTLIRERYKVVQVLDEREDYAFVLAVDILDREQRSYLLNIYHGPLLRAFLPGFNHMSACSEFQGMFVDGDRLVTVFEDVQGMPIDWVFHLKAKFDWRTRLEYAELLLHQALNLTDLPAEVGCPAMLSENVLINLNNDQVRLRFKVVPLEETDSRELARLAGQQAKKILAPQFFSPMEQLDFLDELDRGGFAGMVQLYALWRERREQIQEACEQMEQKGFFQRCLSQLWRRIKRKMGRSR